MSHYNQYKETIKEVTKRNYRQRSIWVNEFLADKSCCQCGEVETVCLKFHPHDTKIRSLSKRKGLNNHSRKEIIELIDKSMIVCSNCYLKIENDILEPI